MSRTVLILIATGQNWPNAIAYEYYKGHPSHPVDQVYIYSTEAMKKSAAALEEFVGHGVVAHDKDELCKDQDDSSVSFLRFIQSFGEDDSLFINMSGGLKLFWLHIHKILSVPRVTAFYRELNGGWYQLKPDGEEPLQLFNEREKITYDDPAKLIQLQIMHPGVKIDATRYEPPNARRLIEKFLERSLSQRKVNGTAWEWFVADAADYVGLKVCRSSPDENNQRKGVMVRVDGSPILEEDVFATSSNRPFLFECKADKGHQSASEVLSKLSSSARQFGGLKVGAYLVTPGWRFAPEQKVAATLLGITYWGPDELKEGFFSRLIELSKSQDPEVKANGAKYDEQLRALISELDGDHRFVYDLTEKTDEGKRALIPMPRPIKDHIKGKEGSLSSIWSLDSDSSVYSTRIRNRRPTALFAEKSFLLVTPTPCGAEKDGREYPDGSLVRGSKESGFYAVLLKDFPSHIRPLEREKYVREQLDEFEERARHFTL